VTFSVKGVLNLLYSELNDKKTAHVNGRMAFGEVAYND
jgi:hypothetical protein